MAAHAHAHSDVPDVVRPGPGFGRTVLVAAVVGLICLVAAFALSFTGGGLRRFYFAYLVGFSFVLATVLGSLFFIMIHHLTRAGWNVNLRRIAEAICMGGFPVLAVLSVPVLISVLQGDGGLYRWAKWDGTPQVHHAEHADAGSEAEAQSADTHGGEPTTAAAPHHDAHGHAAPSDSAHDAKAAAPAGHGTETSAAMIDDGKPDEHPSAHSIAPIDELTAKKRWWLNPLFFCGRVVIYFAVLIFLARIFWKESTEQDKTGDIAHTARMQWWSAPGLVMFALTATFIAFDLIMSLDPHWYSTMFGVCVFISGLVCFYAVMIIAVDGLKRLGYLQGSITTEHQHDLAKLMFAFTFFWGYVNFSQYMLLWYASLPETAMWLTHRGATTRAADWDYYRAYGIVAILVGIGCFVLPFPGLLSRHVKRNRGGALFWAGWLLFFHALYFFWMIVPELNGRFNGFVPEALCVIGVAGVVTAGAVKVLSMHDLRPVHDPRVNESLAFQNM